MDCARPRRYEHPWREQARQEVEQALALAEAPVDKRIAGEAVVVAESLAVPCQPWRVEASLTSVRQGHKQLTNVGGL